MPKVGSSAALLDRQALSTPATPQMSLGDTYVQPRNNRALWSPAYPDPAAARDAFDLSQEAEAAAEEVSALIFQQATDRMLSNRLDRVAVPYTVRSVCDELLDTVMGAFVSCDDGRVEAELWAAERGPERVPIDAWARAAVGVNYRQPPPPEVVVSGSAQGARGRRGTAMSIGGFTSGTGSRRSRSGGSVLGSPMQRGQSFAGGAPRPDFGGPSLTSPPRDATMSPLGSSIGGRSGRGADRDTFSGSVSVTRRKKPSQDSGKGSPADRASLAASGAESPPSNRRESVVIADDTVDAQAYADRVENEAKERATARQLAESLAKQIDVVASHSKGACIVDARLGRVVPVSTFDGGAKGHRQRRPSNGSPPLPPPGMSTSPSPGPGHSIGGGNGNGNGDGTGQDGAAGADGKSYATSGGGRHQNEPRFTVADPAPPPLAPLPTQGLQGHGHGHSATNTGARSATATATASPAFAASPASSPKLGRGPQLNPLTNAPTAGSARGVHGANGGAGAPAPSQAETVQDAALALTESAAVRPGQGSLKSLAGGTVTTRGAKGKGGSRKRRDPHSEFVEEVPGGGPMIGEVPPASGVHVKQRGEARRQSFGVPSDKVSRRAFGAATMTGPLPAFDDDFDMNARTLSRSSRPQASTPTPGGGGKSRSAMATPAEAARRVGLLTPPGRTAATPGMAGGGAKSGAERRHVSSFLNEPLPKISA